MGDGRAGQGCLNVILSNVEIVEALKKGLFSIDPQPPGDPSAPPFNTSALDLRLGNEINVPKTGGSQIQLDLRKGGIARFLADHCEVRHIDDDQPYSLRYGRFVLASTHERVAFPLDPPAEPILAARVAGKSSLARCGLLVHFTAPTIHAGFSGHITLEMINLGPADILLTPGSSFASSFSKKYAAVQPVRPISS
jgi:dCTP deaminase